jgi:hypothetical protein
MKTRVQVEDFMNRMANLEDDENLYPAMTAQQVARAVAEWFLDDDLEDPFEG